MRTRIGLPALLAVATLTAAYQYSFTDTLTSINLANWYQNGSLTATPGGLTAPDSNGGSLISKVGVPGGYAEYEVKSTLTLAASGGTYATYLRASSDALSGSSPQGSYYAWEIQNPTFSGSACTATLALYKRVSGTITLLASSTPFLAATAWWCGPWRSPAAGFSLWPTARATAT